MSSTMFSQHDPSTTQTRRTLTRGDYVENDNQRNVNHRSLSGKFRSLFRKNSASPNRYNTTERIPSPMPMSQQRSPSAGALRTETEGPLLRAPLVEWPSGKKKTKLPPSETTTTKSKGKFTRNSKKKPIPTAVEVSAPVRTDQYQTSIYGQTFVPRTPELSHGGTGRIQSSASYETTTRGFRDYTVLDNPRPPQKVVVPNVDAISPSSYSSDFRRSPTFDYQDYRYTNVDYPQHHDTFRPSQTISKLEIIPGPAPQRHVNSTLQSLVESTPTLPQTPVVSSPGSTTTNSHHWRRASTTSLDNSERYSTLCPTIDADAPKLHAPIIPLSSRTNKKDTKQTDAPFRSDDLYHSSISVNKLDRPYIGTYSPTFDRETVHSDNSISYTPSPPYGNTNSYLTAIVQHHMRPTSTIYGDHPWIVSNDSHQGHRFDASTTTFRGYNRQDSPSPTDGFIRPLSPSKSPVQNDVSIIHMDPTHDYRSASHTSYTTPSDIPVTYRSSATIYTRDKQNFSPSGEIRTWSARDNDETSTSQKSSTSIFVDRIPNDPQTVPLTLARDSPYKPKLYGHDISNYADQQEGKYASDYTYARYGQQQEYTTGTRYFSTSRYSDSTADDQSFTRSPLGLQRENVYNQGMYSYKDADDRTQEPLDAMTPAQDPDLTLRHYTLKRSDSYNGLGIVITADAETRLNHRIRDVEPSSPGCRIGLRKNDRIVSVNGVNVEKLEFADVLILIKEGLTKNDLQVSVINEAVLI